LIVATWKRRTVSLVARAIYFIGLHATSNIFTATGTIFAERLAYFPSAGFCLLVAFLFIWLASRQRAVAFTLLAVAAAGFGVRTVARNRDWRDNASLYMSAAEAAPNSAKMRAFRGIVYIGRNQLDRARADLQVALAFNPDYPDAVEAMGLLELRAGNQPKALQHLQRALEISSPLDFDYDYRAANLSGLQIQMGKLDDAMKLLNRRIAESPSYSALWSNRAALHMRLGQMDAAREDARAALGLDPHNLAARNVLQHPQAGSLH